MSVAVFSTRVFVPTSYCGFIIHSWLNWGAVAWNTTSISFEWHVGTKYVKKLQFPLSSKAFLFSKSFPPQPSVPCSKLISWNLTTRCLTVSGGGSVAADWTSSVAFWLHYNVAILPYFWWHCWSFFDTERQQKNLALGISPCSTGERSPIRLAWWGGGETKRAEDCAMRGENDTLTTGFVYLYKTSIGLCAFTTAILVLNMVICHSVVKKFHELRLVAISVIYQNNASCHEVRRRC